MPTTAGGFTFRNNIEPTIYAQPQSDLERRFKLAQLANLESQPDIESRRLGLQEQSLAESRRQNTLENLLRQSALGETTAHNITEETDAQTKNQIARDALTQQLQITHEANKRSMAEAVMTHLPNLLSGTPSQGDAVGIASGALSKLGYPELASSLNDAHKVSTEKKVATALAQVNALQAKPDALNNYLPTLKSDPDVWNAIKDKLPSGVTVPDTAPVGAKAGGVARSLLMTNKFAPSLTTNPLETAAYLGATGARGVAKKYPSISGDFLDAFLGRTQPTTP